MLLTFMMLTLELLTGLFTLLSMADEEVGGAATGVTPVTLKRIFDEVI